MSFPQLAGLPVVVDFEGGAITSDAGMLFLRQIDDRLGLCAQLAACLVDRRQGGEVRHDHLALLRQRIFQIAGGYCDANDADALRTDPALKTAVGRNARTGADLASQPTISRLKNTVRLAELRRLNDVLLRSWLRHRPRPTRAVVLDFDATDDPVHGQQEFAFFSGFYGNHVYLPLLCYDGETGDLIGVALQPGNAAPSAKMMSMLRRIVRGIRATWPGVEIIVRGDNGFARPELYRSCERRSIGYLVGFGINKRLERFHAPLLAAPRPTCSCTTCAASPPAPRSSAPSSTSCGCACSRPAPASWRPRARSGSTSLPQAPTAPSGRSCTGGWPR